MAATTVALLVLVLWATTSTRLGRWSRLLGTVTAVGLVALTAATYSRAALGAIFLVGGLALLRDARRGRALLYLAVGIGLLIVLVGPLASGFDDRAGLGDRITIAKAAVEVGADQPLFGIGFAALPSRLWLPATGDVYHAHFLPAHYFVELGLVGLAGFALVIVSVVRNSRHSRMGRIALWGALVFAVLDVGVFLYPRSAAVIWLALLITAEPVDRAATTPA
jgi:O-antigen ligase